jgi:hypothetical protein
MQLIGQAIRHETFGKGVVTDCSEHTLTVCFSSGDKRFLYPDAFEKRHLILRDTAMQDQIQGMLDQRDAQRTAQRQALLDQQERAARLQGMKLTRNSQAAFNLSPAQADALLQTWTVFTGTYLSGPCKGDPRVPDRMKPNSLCLLTQRPEGGPESRRRIIGGFMVREDFFGNGCLDGMIQAHPDYRIALPKAHQPLFWSYFPTAPEKQRWGNMALKYFSIETAEQILFDWCAQDWAAEEAASFYRYFCTLNRLPVRQRDQG